MPECEFFAEVGEVDNLVRFVLAQDFYLIPSMHYPTSEVIRIHDLQSYKRAAAQTDLISGPFFVMSPTVSLWPLTIKELEGDTGRFYYIEYRHGGPSLSFSWRRSYEKDGIRWYPSGAVGHYPTYKNTLTGEFEKIPAVLRSKYNDIARYIKERARLYEQLCPDGGIRGYWILPEVDKAIKEGARLVGIDSWDTPTAAP